MRNKTLLIFNPRAGGKRKLIPAGESLDSSAVKELLERYQINVDYAPTRKASDVTTFAKDAVRLKYERVLVAGGDGTVGTVANELVGKDITLGILPMGTFMNIARMLAIPLDDMEKAVQLIKIDRSRKIDVGAITTLGGKKLRKPIHFIEQSAVGFEARFQKHFVRYEKGETGALMDVVKSVVNTGYYKAKVWIDDKDIPVKVPLIIVSNGPYSDAALPMSPKAKLDDHRLTVSLFKMSKLQLINFYLKKMLIKEKRLYPEVKTYSAKTVRLQTPTPRLVHADARVFGTTPVEYRIVPFAIKVITGFPEDGDSAFTR